MLQYLLPIPFLPLIIIILTLIYIYYPSWRRNQLAEKNSLSVLPCLPWLPVVGSLPFLPRMDKMHLALMTLTEKYGNVFALYTGSHYTVVLNDYESIKEALVKKALDFAGRESIFGDFKVVNKESRGIGLSPYDERHKYVTQITMAIFKDFGYGHDSIMEFKIHSELQELVKTWTNMKGATFNPSINVMNFTNNVISRMLFGTRFTLDDPTAKMLMKAIKAYFEASDILFNMFPFLIYLPKYQKRFIKLRALWVEWKKFMLEKIEHRDETSETNFAREYVNRTGENYEEIDLLAILKDMTVAGTDTLHYTTDWTIILLGNHPAVKEKLRAEVDSVVPRDRFPSLDDRQRLPYLEAVLLESMRLKTMVPLALPHKTTRDTELNGYFIPGDTRVFVNLWSAHMNPKMWKDPEVFRPERFLDEDNQIINKDFVISFSLGKRSCTGELLARQELFLIIATTIQKFDILPPEGQEKIIYKEMSNLICSPEDFTLRLIPRVD